MIAMRRLLAAGLALHGAIHVLGVAVAWRWVEPDGLPNAREIIGGVEVGDGGMRLLGVIWLLSAVAFLVAAGEVLDRREWAASATAAAATTSAVICLLQIDFAWRGLVIDLLLLFALVVAWTVRTHESPGHEATR
jgi:hypothetical protein